MIEELRIGAEVLTADGRRVGNLKYIIVDTADGTVSAVAVEPGLLESGRLLEPTKWDEPSAVIVPIDLIAHADAEVVRLRCSESELRTLPPYIEQEYVHPDESWTPPPGYTLADFLLRLTAPFGGIIPPPMKIRLRKGRTEREIEPGTPVWRKHPHTEVGHVERVLFDPETDKVTGLVLRRGGLVPFHVALPMHFVTEILDDVIHVEMTDEEIESLAPFNPPDEA